jgi:hypothetical protein
VRDSLDDEAGRCMGTVTEALTRDQQ